MRITRVFKRAVSHIVRDPWKLFTNRRWRKITRMKLTTILIVLAVSLMHNGYAQMWRDYCINPHGLAGSCINIRMCQPLLNLLITQSQVNSAMQFLRNAQCGFNGNDPKVCCVMENPNPNPINPYPNPNPVNPYPNPVNPSRNPNPVDRYPNSNPVDRYPNSNPVIPYPATNPVNNDFDPRSLLPSDCGRELIFRIIGGEAVALDEYPWMVLLEYQKPNGNSTACGGVLISSRYVLTAAHCIKGKDLPKTWSLIGVRLGEYNTETNPDCANDGGGARACAPPVTTIGIEQQITHESYNPHSKNQIHDIALLRLSGEITFGDYMKPVCLPSSKTIPSRLVVAGWGKTETRSDSNVKLKVSVPLSDRDECEKRYGNAGVQLQGSQICAGGEKGKDSCRGDSGGPLMSAEKNAVGSRWSVIGIVSFGPSPCGMAGWPAIYTKVADYTDWILRNIRP